MSRRFKIILEQEKEGGYQVCCPAQPGCHTQGETIDEAVRNVREAIQLYVESLLKDGLPVPEDDMPSEPNRGFRVDDIS